MVAQVLDCCEQEDAGELSFADKETIVFRIPQSFHFGKELPPDLWECFDDAHWLLDTLIRKSARDETDENDYAHLHSRYLRRVMDKRNYRKVIEALIERGWIDPPTTHSAGRWSKGYRLNEKHLAEPYKRIKASDSGSIHRIQDAWESRRQEQQKLWLPIHHQLAEMLQELTILPAADAYLARLPQDTQIGQEVHVDRIRDGCPHFSVGNTGRCYSSFTGLKRDLRPYLRLAGEPLAGVDICSAQPALLVELAHLFEGKCVPTYIQILLRRSSSYPLTSLPGSGLPGLSLLTAETVLPSLVPTSLSSPIW